MRVSFGTREVAVLLVLLLAAFLVRFLFFWHQGYASVDTVDFSLWFQRAAEIGPRPFYSGGYWCDYPPLNIYLFWGFGLLAKNLGVFGTNLFTYIMKLPANIFDMATAALIFFFVRKRFNFKWALIASALYAFNPAVIFDTAVWGQWDAIYTFFLVSSLMLVFSEKPKLAVIAYLLGVLTKPQSIALAPLFFYLLWRKSDWKGFLTSVVVGAATIFAVILPFEWSDPVSFLTNIYFGAYGTYQYTTLNAFNVWGFGGMWVADTQATFVIGWLMFGVAAAFALHYVSKSSRLPRHDFELAVLVAALLSFFAFFMLPTRIHERYLFPAVAILALLVPFLKKIRPLYVVLTATCLVNQAYVLSFLVSGTFIQQGDLVVLVVSTANSIALLYLLVMMVTDLPRFKQQAALRMETEAERRKPPEPESSPEPEGPEGVPRRISWPKLTKRDALSILVLCIVFFALATYNLGYSSTPISETKLQTGQSFYFDLGRNGTVVSIYFLIHDGTYNVSVYAGAPNHWASTVSNKQFSDYYKWNEVAVSRVTQYLRVDILYADDKAALLEAAASNGSTQIPLQSVIAINSTTSDLTKLTDEQDKIHLPFTYMSQTYFDEIYFVRTAEQYLNLESPYEWTHPPLGKLIQAGGIVVFGFNPFGWRIVGVLFAMAMIPVIYVLGKKLFGTWIGAFSAAFLLTFEFMHFTMGRMGTADTYVVFFTLISQLFFFLYFAQVVKKGWRTPLLPLFLAVIFFMLGFSTKWLALYGALGMLGLLVLMRLRELRKLKGSFGDKYAAFFDYPFMRLLGFILIGVGLYFLIYVPDMLTGRPFFGTNGVIDLQFHMYGYHANLVASHPFSSPWWSWPILVSPTGYVPLWLAVSYLPGGVVSTISAFGNPAVWWVGFFCIIVLTERAIRGKELATKIRQQARAKIRQAKNFAIKINIQLSAKIKRRNNSEPSPPIPNGNQSIAVEKLLAPELSESEKRVPIASSSEESGATPSKTEQADAQETPSAKISRGKHDLAAIFIVTVFFFSWVPYVLISRVTFIYHFYVCVPFLCLSSAYFINKIWRTRRGKAAAIVFFAAVVAMFILFYPVISGMPVSTDWVHKLKWFPSWYFAP